MAQDKPLTQVIVSGMSAVGYTLSGVGSADDQDFTTDKPVRLTVSAEDFEDKEDWHKVSILVTRAVRRKVSKLIAEGKSDDIYSNAS